MMRHVMVTCTGRASAPHTLRSLALFSSRVVGTEEQWEEEFTGSRDYSAAWVEAGKDPTMAGFDALLDHPGKPRQRVTIAMSVDGVPVPDNIEGGAEGLRFWAQRHAYTKYEITCPTCGLNLSQRVEKVWPKLTAANVEEYGVSRVLLRDII